MTSTYIQIQCTSCHAEQQWYTYTVTEDSNNQVPGIAQKAGRNRRRQGAANIRSGGPIPRNHSPDGATWHASGNQACYSFIDPGGMKG